MSPTEFVSMSRGQLAWIREVTRVVVVRGVLHWHGEGHARESSSAREAGPCCLRHLYHDCPKPGGCCFHPGRAPGWGGSSCGWQGSGAVTVSQTGSDMPLSPVFCTQEPSSGPSHFLFPPSGKAGCLCPCLLIPGEEKGGLLHSREASGWIITHAWGQGGQRAVLMCSLQLPGWCLHAWDWQHFRLPQRTYVSRWCPQPTSGQDFAVQNSPHLAWSCNRPWDGDLRACSGSATSQHWQLVAYIYTWAVLYLCMEIMTCYDS